MTTVGWIGLGAMGAPMATCVARAGYTVTAFDIDPQRAVALAGDGVKPAATVTDRAAAGRGCPGLDGRDRRAGRSVLYGDGNAAAALKPGAVVLLMATVGPAAVEDWAKRLGPPASRSSTRPCPAVPPAPAQGDLLIMVSGSEAALGRACNRCWT